MKKANRIFILLAFVSLSFQLTSFRSPDPVEYTTTVGSNGPGDYFINIPGMKDKKMRIEVLDFCEKRVK